MKTHVMLVGIGLALSMMVVGCSQADKPETSQTAKIAKCPGCGMQVKEGTFCAKCKAVATTSTAMVHCKMCQKDFKSGLYCAKCNRFMFDKKVKCKSGKKMCKGAYDSTTNSYVGLPHVGYCKACKKPYDKAAGCPCCAKKKKK